MAHKEIRNLKDLSQQQVHQGEILNKKHSPAVIQKDESDPLDTE